jgi:hypothetical protein
MCLQKPPPTKHVAPLGQPRRYASRDTKNCDVLTLEEAACTAKARWLLSHASNKILLVFTSFKFCPSSLGCFRAIKLNYIFQIEHQLCVIIFSQYRRIPIFRQPKNIVKFNNK